MREKGLLWTELAACSPAALKSQAASEGSALAGGVISFPCWCTGMCNRVVSLDCVLRRVSMNQSALKKILITYALLFWQPARKLLGGKQ